MAWFKEEQHVLRSMISQAARAGLDTHATQLPATMAAYLSRNGRWHELAALQRTALAAGRRFGDQQAQAQAHYGIGDALIKLGSRQRGHAHLQHALRLLNQLGDHSCRARTHYAIAGALEKQQRHREALGHAQRALRLCRAVGDRVGQAFALNAVGWFHALLGNHPRAQALAAYADVATTTSASRPSSTWVNPTRPALSRAPLATPGSKPSPSSTTCTTPTPAKSARDSQDSR